MSKAHKRESSIVSDYTQLLTADTAAHHASHEAVPQPLFRRRWLTVSLLVGINLLNYLDRYTISGILPDLKDKGTSGLDHNVSDSQGGLLMTVFVARFEINVIFDS